VTEQPWNHAAGHDTPAQQPSGYPPGYPPQHPQYPQYPQYPQHQGPAPYYDPAAPFGRHPVTGQPYSDKSKTTAGLLQLLSVIGIGGIGRFYLGDIGIGVAQLLLGPVCGAGLIWSIIDAIMILSDKVPDSQGRPLRDGT
jgi:TM2 domain-containing membrane protein YozV